MHPLLTSAKVYSAIHVSLKEPIAMKRHGLVAIATCLTLVLAADVAHAQRWGYRGWGGYYGRGGYYGWGSPYYSSYGWYGRPYYYSGWYSSPYYWYGTPYSSSYSYSYSPEYYSSSGTYAGPRQTSYQSSY